MSISSAIDTSAVARVVGIKTSYKDLRGGGIMFLPQRIAVVGQGNTGSVYSTTKAQIYSAAEVAETYGYGSPLHLAVLQLMPSNGDGVGTIPVTVYPLEDDASGVAAVGDITPGGTQTIAEAYTVSVNNIESESFVISAGDSVSTITAAMTESINAVVDMPATATDGGTKVTLTAKWKGESGNDLYIGVNGSTTAGTTFALTQPTGGLVNPDVQDAIDQIGDIWETLVLNCLNINDSTALDTYSTFGTGRWGSLTRKPLIVFTGNTSESVDDATTVSDVRKTDRTNCQLVSPGSKDLPFVVAAGQLARIAPIAQNNPARDYGGQEATYITPGEDGVQWLYNQRDSAVKKGSSTIEVKDGVVNISDTVTMYHPTGDVIPPYRYVCDIVKLQNIIFNIDLIFAAKEWNGAPLIPDDQPTINREAKKPKMAVAAVAGMLDSLGLNAIISDPDTAKSRTQAAINEQNPKRLDVATTVQLCGNTNIISVDLEFGFYFGVAPLAA
jgi:phage tail sheath gpL-like